MEKALDVIIANGRDIWEAAYRGTRDPVACFHRMKTLAADEYAKRRNEPHGFIAQYVWPAAWYDAGLQRIEIGAKFAASLACTAARAADVDVELPFPAFLVQLPEGFLESAGSSISFVTVMRYGNTLQMGAFHGVTSVFFATVQSVNALMIFQTEEEIERLISDRDRAWRDTSGKHDRCLEVLRRLVFGVCAYLQGPEPESRRVLDAERTVRTNARGEPVARTHRLSPVVHTDCRDYVRSFLRGERATVPHVRTLVMGHYRNQAHGPRHLARKVIWIQPHWRGSEGAPLAVRPHVLRDGGELAEADGPDGEA